MEVIRRFSDDEYAQALKSWAWLGLGQLTPQFTSPFGDVFLESQSGWWFLDTMDGSLSEPWASQAELQAALNTSDGQHRYLLLPLAVEAEAAGLTPGGTEILSLTVPAVLGGELSVSNISVTEFVVSVNVAGQIHDQVRKLPPGTAISGVTIA